MQKRDAPPSSAPRCSTSTKTAGLECSIATLRLESRPLAFPVRLAVLPSDGVGRSRSSRPSAASVRPRLSRERGLRPVGEAAEGCRRRERARAARAQARARRAGIAAPRRSTGIVSTAGRSAGDRPSSLRSSPSRKPSSPGVLAAVVASPMVPLPRQRLPTELCLRRSKGITGRSRGAGRGGTDARRSKIGTRGTAARRFLPGAPRVAGGTASGPGAVRPPRGGFAPVRSRSSGGCRARDGRLPGADAVSLASVRSHRRAS